MGVPLIIPHILVGLEEDLRERMEWNPIRAMQMYRQEQEGHKHPVGQPTSAVVRATQTKEEHSGKEDRAGLMLPHVAVVVADGMEEEQAVSVEPEEDLVLFLGQAAPIQTPQVAYSLETVKLRFITLPIKNRTKNSVSVENQVQNHTEAKSFLLDWRNT